MTAEIVRTIVNGVVTVCLIIAAAYVIGKWLDS